MRSMYLVSPERTTRKSEAAKLRRYEVAGFSSLKEDCDKEGQDALSPSNELCSLQKVSPERSLSCIKDA